MPGRNSLAKVDRVLIKLPMGFRSYPLKLTAALAIAGLSPLFLASTLRADSIKSSDANSQHLTGIWALTDNNNVLINLLVREDGSSLTVRGQRHPNQVGTERILNDNLLEQGQWTSWGNGIRSESPSGWVDTIQLGPAGFVQWSWEPGASLNRQPTNHGKAVKLTSPLMQWVGAYRLVPTQPELPPYTSILTSAGLAFNDIDHIADGSWRVEENGHVMIKWTSGWRTLIRSKPPAVGASFSVYHWKPGIATTSAPSAMRTGERL